jgi:3-(3-hydroxy-phenyl)propionate hydroxylase
MTHNKKSIISRSTANCRFNGARGMKTTMELYDAVIVGYGPVGAVLANILGKAGLRIALLDRMAGIYDKPRAINIDHEVMRILQSAGLADAVNAICSPHTGTEFRGLDNRLIKLFAPPKRPFPLGWTPNLMFVQPEFERILREGVARFANVSVGLSHEVRSIEQDAGSACVTIHDLIGDNAIELRARFVLACDGAASTVRRNLGVTQESLQFDECWTVVDAWLKDGAEVPDITTQFCLPSGPTTYVVGPRGLRRWEMKILPHEDPVGYEDLANVRKRLAPFVDASQIDIWRAATYRFHALVAQQWRLGRIFLVGDAAHQTPPFMAQGLCSGIRDAGNLAWKLIAVLQGRAPDRLLDSYEAERKPHITQLVATTKALGEIIGELDWDRARLRDQLLGDALDRGEAETLRQKFIPDLTAGLLARDDAGTLACAAGTLFVQPSVTDVHGITHRLDDLIGERFAIVTLGQEAQRWLTGTAKIQWQGIGGQRIVVASAPQFGDGPIATYQEEGTLLQDWMSRFGEGAVVVRPDKYVFGFAHDEASLQLMVGQLASANEGRST